MSRLFIELTQEEIPARMQAAAGRDLERLFMEALTEARLSPGTARHLAGPCHLALEIDRLADSQPDIEEERRGPRGDAPDKAIDGFCASAGLARDQLELRETEKGSFYFAQIRQPGRKLADLLPAMLQDILSRFPWPKSQRWGTSRMTWVRPLHAVSVLLDGQPVAGRLDLGGGMELAFGAASSGHRFHHKKPVPLSNMDSYIGDMKKAFVLVDAAERRQMITAQAEKIAAGKGLAVKPDAALLDEVVGLAEWPNVIAGQIDDEFMALPGEVLVTSMRVHQKYFATLDKAGAVAPVFLTVSNRLADADNDQLIAAGNERVLRARLSDAAFFWEQDKKAGLDEWVTRLDKITFYEGLGSVGDKARRLPQLVKALAGQMPGCNADLAAEAARLAKADLVSGMVGEFPELQGIMGGHYAKHHALDEKIALAISDHYRPQGPQDRLPATPEGLAVALADKIDTLAGFFGIGQKPTGSRDPFALRRAALAILRILDEGQLRFDLAALFRLAAQLHGFQQPDADLPGFVTDRLAVRLRETGLAHDRVAAALRPGDIGDIGLQIARAKALDRVLDSQQGAALMAGFRRASNILAAELKKQNQTLPEPDAALFETEAEKTLLAAVLALPDGSVTDTEGLARQMDALAGLEGPINQFFEAVIVNDDRLEVRQNRLGLLQLINRRMMQIADFSKVER
jgi:glycyl-tRNA synthetase beta chain